MMKRTIYTTSIQTLADLLTPVSVYARLRDLYPNALLLESSDYHNASESHSFICLDPIAGFEAKGKAVTIQHPGSESEQHTAANNREVLETFRTFLNGFEGQGGDLPVKTAGFFGYTGFEAVQYMEDIELQQPADGVKDNPDMKYQLFRFVLVFDHFTNQLYLTQNHPDQLPESDQLTDLLAQLSVPGGTAFRFNLEGEETADTDDATFRERVLRGIAHCHRGDVFQVVLSREFRQRFQGDEFNVYRSLRSINPSPYLFFFDYGDFRIFGSSPESQLQVDGRQASIDPIAGTVRRSADEAEDRKRAEHLKADPKENAEHVMLVDLARNDLSKHADGVAVERYAEIQQFSHVIHMVSKVSGTIREGNSGLDVFADTFPAGTLSGAPKYRALEIIRDQETGSRNFYGGALGFFGFDGTVNHAIIIRSMLSKHNTLVFQAGAGVVADSTPEGELQEVNNKVAALRLAIKNAENL